MNEKNITISSQIQFCIKSRQQQNEGRKSPSGPGRPAQLHSQVGSSLCLKLVLLVYIISDFGYPVLAEELAVWGPRVKRNMGPSETVG